MTQGNPGAKHLDASISGLDCSQSFNTTRRRRSIKDKRTLEKEYLPKLLKHLMLSSLQKNFRQLKYRSVTYKRDRAVAKQVKILSMVFILKRKISLTKANALNSIKTKALQDHSNALKVQLLSQHMFAISGSTPASYECNSPGVPKAKNDLQYS